MRDRQAEEPTLVYLMGAGRCGSTILSIIMAAHPEVESVGEIKAWPLYRGLPRDIDEKGEDYIFWAKVLEEYRQITNRQLDFDKLTRICRNVEAKGKLPAYLVRKTDWLPPPYLRHNRALIAAIYKVSRKKVILDSSKNVCRAFLLLRNNSMNVKVIHLIRDPRGTLWSFMKKNLEQEPKKTYRAIFDYIVLNGVAAFIRFLYRDRVIKVKYEDLIDQPAAVVQLLLEFIGLEKGNIIDLLNNNAEFQIRHLIDGNRVRKNKTITFNADEEWKKRLPWAYNLLCMVIARPFYFL